MKSLRSFFIIASMILGLLILSLMIAGIALSIYGPLHPGNLLFPFQYVAEQQMRIIYSNPYQRTAYQLDLVERRIQDLTTRTGTNYEITALDYLNKSLDITSKEIALISQNGSSYDLKSRFFLLIFQINDVIGHLGKVPLENVELFQKFQAKIQAFIQMVQTPGLQPLQANINTPGNINTSSQNPIPTSTPSSASGLVPFPPGSPGAEHAFYPIIGQHAITTCSDCHDQAIYNGIAKTCIACHMDVRPVPHFPGKCELCHTPYSWTDIQFDHVSTQAGDCISCHFLERPADHYQGQCSACHVVDAWEIIFFDHAVAGAVDCSSCHVKDTPPNHYTGQCSRCHITTDWKTVSFDHTGYTDCISCHEDKVPANHFTGQCSRCHNTSNWTSVVFDHSGFTDCVSCHSGDAPGNHYSGQCSRCHSTSTWQGAVFDHSGLTDCVSCHNADAPGGHYPGQCSNCHSTGGSWKNAHFDHSGFTDCISCHSGDAPGNHYPGQCSNCHSTSGSWQNAHFDHSGFTDCNSCHSQDRPAEHDSGQCSECHNTSGWGDGGGDGLISSYINVKLGLNNINCQSCHYSSGYYLINNYLRPYELPKSTQY